MTGNGRAHGMESPVGQGSAHGTDFIRRGFEPVNAHHGHRTLILKNKGVRIGKIFYRLHGMLREREFNASQPDIFCSHPDDGCFGLRALKNSMDPGEAHRVETYMCSIIFQNPFLHAPDS